MSPEYLTHLLTGLDRAADVVEAIDNPQLQQEQGWDLSRWRYDLVPWGVRFHYHDPHSRHQAEVLALLAFAARPALAAGATGGQTRPVGPLARQQTVLLFGR